MACLYADVSPNIFTRIMNMTSAKTIWDYLKGEYQDDELSEEYACIKPDQRI